MKLKLTAIGHVGAASLFAEEGKTKVLNIDLAVNTRVDGKEVTTWIRVKIWNERGEKLAPHVGKGDMLLVEGRPELKMFTRKDGTSDVDLVLHAFDVVFLSAKKRADGEAEAA